MLHLLVGTPPLPQRLPRIGPAREVAYRRVLRYLAELARGRPSSRLATVTTDHKYRNMHLANERERRGHVADPDGVQVRGAIDSRLHPARDSKCLPRFAGRGHYSGDRRSPAAPAPVLVR